MLLRRPAPAEAAAAAAAAAAEEYVRSTSFSCSSSCKDSNSRVHLILSHAPQLQRLRLQAPICVDNFKSSQQGSAAQLHSIGTPQSTCSTNSACSSHCFGPANSVQVRCGLVGRALFDTAPGSPSPKHWTPGHLQQLLRELLPLRPDMACSSSGPSRKTSRHGSRPALVDVEPGSLQAQRALHRLHAALAHAHTSEHLLDQLLETLSHVDVEPAVVETLTSLLSNTTLIDPHSSLDTFGEAAARVICALTAHESSIPNRDVFGQSELGLPAALARTMVPLKATAELQLGYSVRMSIEAARIVRNLAAYKHSHNQTVLGRTAGVIPGLLTLLCEESAGEGKVVAAEALYNLMFEHPENTLLVAAKANDLLAGLSGLLNVDPEHRMAPKYANRYRIAACKVLYLLAWLQPSFRKGIMQYDSLAIPCSLEEVCEDAAAPELLGLAQAILTLLNCKKRSQGSLT